MTGQAGWAFGAGSATASISKLARTEEGTQGRSNILIVSDIQSQVDRIREMIAEIDIEPAQILIEAKVMEVDRDLLDDLGIDWGTGGSGASSSTITTMPLEKKSSGDVAQAVGAHALGPQPSIFDPETTGLTAANAGLKLVYQHLKGNQFEIILHALEEDINTNTLSAPRIMTVNNQEATIIVGTRWPIIETTVEEGVVTESLGEYQEIGIQLNVVPQVNSGNLISMVVHPVITEKISEVGTNRYPVLTTREAETRILMVDGETVVIGGLLKELKKEGVIGVPLLKDLPLIGMFFRRETKDIEKIDLLIFLTAKIIKKTGAGIERAQAVVDVVPERFTEMFDKKFSEETVEFFSKEEEDAVKELLSQ